MDFSCWAELKNLHIIFNLKRHCYDQKGDIFSIHKQMKIPFNINTYRRHDEEKPTLESRA